ncbi:MAG: HNH endonuclease signature motif containing protein [Liquorilactobacillus hordei]|uniref:HNH endonuclease signature motif containing protein n=1 Tax=Liquorilactobacillus hordei TaxID=468911 RepID=UPI0039ECAB7A
MSRLLTEEQENFVRKNIKGIGNKELTKMINKKFNLDIQASQIKSWKNNRRLSSGLDGRYHKGHIPANKGKHQAITGRMSETMFKPGNRPNNWMPVGTIRKKADGYFYKKIKNDGLFQRRWKQLHRIIWEEAKGPIPKGQKLIFLDGNKEHVKLNNLALVSLQESLEINRNGLIFSDGELTKTGINIAKLNVKKNTRKRKNRRNKYDKTN